MVGIELVTQQVINGLLFGGQMALVAVGLTLIWGVMNVLNFAHGSMLMIGGYLGLYTINYTGSLLLGILAAATGVFAIGAIANQVIVQKLKAREDADISLIIGTFGLAIVLQHGVDILLGSRQLAFPSILEGTWQVAWLTLSKTRVILFAIAVVTILLLFAFVQFTKLGFAIRAVSQDADTAKLMGVEIGRAHV